MRHLGSLKRAWRRAALATVVGVFMLGGAVYAATALPAIQTITPHSANDITNLDVLRQQIKNYYGTPLATTGSGTTSAQNWTTPLNMQSNYAKEAESVAAAGTRWLVARSRVPDAKIKAIVLDVDDTTLTTWNYELYSNWDYNPGTNATFVTDQLFPATPGMVAMVKKAANLGYAVFFITGRPVSQGAATLGNLGTDGIGVDAGYPTPTMLFLKPPVGSYPAYLNKPEFCAAAITAGTSCATIPYKAGTRAYIESLGYDIVADFGDQFSDLKGGFADRLFKMPNPNYFLP